MSNPTVGVRPTSPREKEPETPASRVADVQAPIRNVTVYNDRARITREVEVSLPAGKSRVHIGGLTAGLDEASIRARLAEAGCRVAGVSAEWEGHIAPSREEEAVVLEEIERLQREIATLNDERSALEVRQSLAQQYAAHARDAISTAASDGTDGSAETWTESLRFLGEEQDQTAERLRAIFKELADEQEKLNAFYNDLQQLRAPASHRTRRIEVVVEADEAIRTSVAIDYVVYEAWWSAAYDVRTQDGEIELTYYGTVTQGTGEDWKDVRLTLSTARPSESAQIPRLTPVQLTGYKREKRPVEIVSYGTAKDKSDDRGGAPEGGGGFGGIQEQEKADTGRAALGDSGEAITFVIDGTETIPADRRPHKVEVTRGRVPGKIGFETIPKVAPWVYQKAEATNDTGFPILAGPVNVFRGATYVGSGHLEHVANGERFSVSLGSDERVKVKRIIDERSSSKPKILGTRRTISYAYRIELSNYSGEPRTVTLIENIPVSEREELEVTLHESTKPTSQDDEGFIKWKVELDPRETKVIPFGYQVSYPKDWSIHGL